MRYFLYCIFKKRVQTKHRLLFTTKKVHLTHTQQNKKTTKEMECAVCYCNQANCKLICKHSFCKDCVKQWYLSAADEPSCPMCRHRLYFKGMYKLVREWEEESIDKKNEEAFAEAFDYIVNEESEDEYSESESEDDSEIDEGEESEWEELPWDSEQSVPEEQPSTPSARVPMSNWAYDSDSESESDSEINMELGDCRMLELMEIQERFRLLCDNGYDIETELLVNNYYRLFKGCAQEYYEDAFKLGEEIFISKHQGVQNGVRRCSARIQGKRDHAGSSIDFAVVLVCV